MKPIELLFAENVISRRGSHSRQRLIFCASTERRDVEQKVAVHWAGVDGSWRVTPAHATRSRGEREIWMAEVTVESSGANHPLPEAVEFALHYRAAGSDWWHKDGDRNLRIERDTGVLLGERIVLLNLRPERFLASDQRDFATTIAVRDDFRPCTVKIRWTTDYWQTVRSSECHFSPYYWQKAHSGASNPNCYSVGIWTSHLRIERAGRLEYAIACESHRGVFWDNNFGANYVVCRKRLKVLTLNLHCYQEENWDVKFWQIARVINEREVDIVCFQEVAEPWNGGKGDPSRNAARIIRDRLNQPYHIAFDWSHIGFGQYREGSAILSRHDLILKDSGYVSSGRSVYDIHARRIVMAQVSVPQFGVINVFSTHLSWWSDGFRSQFENLRRWADDRHSGEVAATLLCGDFNAEPESEGYAIATMDGEYEDQYLKARRKASGPDADRSNHGRIDYIFLKRGSPLEVVESQPLFTPADYGAVSDHPAYYAEFERLE